MIKSSMTACNIGTNINLLDSGTNPNPAPTHFQQYNQTTGVRFYPPKDSEHYALIKFKLDTQALSLCIYITYANISNIEHIYLNTYSQATAIAFTIVLWDDPICSGFPHSICYDK